MVLITKHSQFTEQLTITRTSNAATDLEHYYDNTKLHREIMQTVLSEGAELINQAIDSPIYYNDSHIITQQKISTHKQEPTSQENINLSKLQKKVKN